MGSEMCIRDRHRACRLRSARDTNTSVAVPTYAAAVATAAAAAAVDTDCLSHCVSFERSSATNVMCVVQVDYYILCTNSIRR